MALRFTIGGRLCGAQRWSVGYGIGFSGPGVTPTPAQMNQLANDLFAKAVAQIWKSGGSAGQWSTGVGNRGTLDSVRTYWDADNTPGAELVGASTTAAVPGVGTNTAPPQIAVCATLLTGLAGRTQRGRSYVPYSEGTDANGLISSATCQALALATATFLGTFQTISFAGQALYPGLYSARRPGATPITAVRVDNVLDTQRRRRDKIIATAAPQSVVPIG